MLLHHFDAVAVEAQILLPKHRCQGVQVALAPLEVCDEELRAGRRTHGREGLAAFALQGAAVPAAAAHGLVRAAGAQHRREIGIIWTKGVASASH